LAGRSEPPLLRGSNTTLNHTGRAGSATAYQNQTRSRHGPALSDHLGHAPPGGVTDALPDAGATALPGGRRSTGGAPESADWSNRRRSAGLVPAPDDASAWRTRR